MHIMCRIFAGPHQEDVDKLKEKLAQATSRAHEASSGGADAEKLTEEVNQSCVLRACCIK